MLLGFEESNDFKNYQRMAYKIWLIDK